MDSGAGVRIRRMELADVDQVMEIAESLPEAPHWPAAAYLAALDPEGAPRRVALVALLPEENGEENPSGAKAQPFLLGLSARLKSCPDTKPELGGESVKSCPDTKPDSSFSVTGERPATQRDPGVRPVVGFAVACVVTQQAELEMIAVAGAAQRQGIAQRLFAALGEELLSTGVTVVALEVRSSNRPALGLYRRLGFQETGLRRRYYADPVEDAVLMSLQIGS
jgi:ribosomal-protein-alanine acetyltransferase